MFELRPYQAQSIQAIRSAIGSGSRCPLFVMPTGAGKTVVMASIVKSARERGSSVLVLAPRRELIGQIAGALTRFDIHAGIIMAGESREFANPVQVASWDTVTSRVAAERMPLPDAGLVLVDEAHLAVSPAREKILEAMQANGSIIIGVTATPCRGNGKGLGDSFDSLVIGASMGQLITDGYLVQPRYYGSESLPDMSGVKVRAGDYAIGELSKRVNEPTLIGDIVSNWRRIADDKQTVVFCVDRRHARHVCDEFVEAGYRAEYVDGETPSDERKAILARVESKQTQVLVNVFVASYGLDIPSLECAVMARPTKSVVLFLQCIGRVLRTSPGKADAIVIDHAGAVQEHGVVEQDWEWSLDTKGTVQERREKSKQAAKEPKEITCKDCGRVFSGRRRCPGCGNEMIPAGKPIPTHEAELVEISKPATMAEKIEFFAELKAHAAAHGYSPGWAAHKHKERFSTWPNDPRFKTCGTAERIRPETLSWLKSQQIRWAKSKQRKAA